MTERSIAHGSLAVERTYPAAPARVFRAWADPKLKSKWYGDPGSNSENDTFEFRNGGREVRGGMAGDRSFVFELRYHDIVPDQRIVYTYEVLIGGTRNSVSLATVEFLPAGAGTRLKVTEHGAFLDGHEPADGRVEGTEYVLDLLGELLEKGEL